MFTVLGDRDLLKESFCTTNAIMAQTAISRRERKMGLSLYFGRVAKKGNY
jgi:hypothetical protein